MYNKVEGTVSILNSIALNSKHFEIVQKFIAANGGDGKMTQKRLREISMELLGLKFGPQWIAKNLAVRVKNVPHGLDLNRFKLAKTTKIKPTPVVMEEEPKTSHAKKESKPKREATPVAELPPGVTAPKNAKRSSKKKVETPAPDAIVVADTTETAGDQTAPPSLD